MKSAWNVCAILLLATGLVAQTSTAPKPKPRPKSATVTAADVQSLKDAIASQQAALAQQQQQIQQLRDELNRKDQVVQQVQATAADAANKADVVQAQSNKDQQAVTELKGDVTDLKTNVASTVVTLQETQKTISEPPTTIHVKGITITPGGFLAAETVRRTRALAADINTPFNALTMPGASASSMSEFFGTGRQSRISLLAEGRLKSVKLSGYYEADFLSAGVTSNNNESNSYTLRQRQVWGQAAFDNGWNFTGGQMWSLVTETKHGLDNRSEALPMTIDPQYTIGFSWARQFGFRLTKNFNNKVWLGVALENSQETLSSHGNASNFLIGSPGAGGGLYNSAVTACSTSINSTTGAATTTCSAAANYSFNPSPDIIAKAAFEPGFGHYEIFGVYSRFRDRVFPCEDIASTTPCGTGTGPNASAAFNTSKNGGGFGANARWSFDKKRIDFGLHALGGSGMGRYGTGGLADTLRTRRRHTRSHSQLSGIDDSRMARAEAGCLPERRSGIREPRGRLRRRHRQVRRLRLTPLQQHGLLHGDRPRCRRIPPRQPCQLYRRHPCSDRRNCGLLVPNLRRLQGKGESRQDSVRSTVFLCDPQRLVRFILTQPATRNRQHDLHVFPLLLAVRKPQFCGSAAMYTRRHLDRTNAVEVPVFNFLPQEDTTVSGLIRRPAASSVDVLYCVPGTLCRSISTGTSNGNGTIERIELKALLPWLVSHSTIPSTS